MGLFFRFLRDIINMPLAKDLLHPRPEEEKRKHKLKRLVQHPNSYFMDVKCPGCYKITTVFSHAQTVVLCVGCSTVLCQPTGGRARLTEERSNTKLLPPPLLVRRDKHEYAKKHLVTHASGIGHLRNYTFLYILMIQ